MEHIAKLENVVVVSHGDFHLGWGNILEDKATYGNHPIADGLYIHTSPIEKIEEVDGSTYIVTKNSVYKVIGDINYQGTPFSEKVS